MEKMCKAKITKSKMHYNRVSLRDSDGEDIRIKLTKLGFEPGDKVVIILESELETEAGQVE